LWIDGIQHHLAAGNLHRSLRNGPAAFGDLALRCLDIGHSEIEAPSAGLPSGRIGHHGADADARMLKERVVAQVAHRHRA
jgi:hypothetical protein